MKNRRLVGLMALLLAVLMALCACAPAGTPDTTQTPEADPTATPAPEQSEVPEETPEATKTPEATESDRVADETYDPYSGMQALAAQIAEAQLEYPPKTQTLANGVTIQRTPQDDTVYNTYVLKADERGCATCHTDLREVLNGLPTRHMDINLVGDSELTVTNCVTCHRVTHEYAPEDYGLGSYLHGLHKTAEFTQMGGDCMSCHDATNDGAGLQLWDEVKYYRFRGITDVDASAAQDDVAAQFVYDQDTLTDPDDLFCLEWLADPYGDAITDAMIYDGHTHGLQTDPATFDSWEVSVEGLVDHPFTMTLPELIETFGSETKTLTIHCTYDTAPGGLVANLEVTGIPLSAILEYAGVQENAIEVYFTPVDEVCTYPATIEHLAANDALLVYEINGERLSIANGYPLWSFVPGMGAPSFVKQLNKLVVADDPVEELYLYRGWVDENMEYGYMNKPSCAFIGLYDGTVVDAGKPYTIEGFADAYDDPITAVEISLDRGNTWITYEVDTEIGRWTHWNFTFTPQEGAYVIMCRAVTEGGLVSVTSDIKLINAK